MIVDAHVHLRGSVFPGDYDRIGAANLVNAMDQAGIQLAIVHNLSNPGENSIILSECSRYPERLTPFIQELPDSPFLGDIPRYVSEGARGIGEIYVKPGSAYPLASYLEPLIQKARENHLPICFHTGDFSYTAPIMINSVIRENPDITFILGHMGSMSYVLDAIEMLKTHANVYADTSGMTSPLMLLKAEKECGANKLLFGSDYPFWDPAVELHRIYTAGFGKIAERKILGENIARILNL